MKITPLNQNSKYKVNFKSLCFFTIILSAVLFLFNFVFEKPVNIIILAVSSIVALVIPTYFAIQKINNKNFFNLNFMISLASVFLFCVGEFHQAFWSAFFNLIIHYVINYTINSHTNTSQLISIIQKKEYHCYINREDVIVGSGKIGQGDMVEISAGEYIPVDGTISAGSGTIDDYYITGNDKIITKFTGQGVLAGSTLLTGNIIVLAEASLADSSLCKTDKVINKACLTLTKRERISNIVFNIISVLIIVALLITTLVSFVKTNNFDILKYGIALMLIASSLDVLYDAINISFCSIIEKAARLGIIISTKSFLEKTLNIKTILFSTFGVLSSKLPKIVRVESIPQISKDDVVKYAAYSQYKLGNELSKALSNYSKEKIRSYNILNYIPLGVIGAITTISGNHEIITGTAYDLESLGIVTGEISDDTVLCVAINKTYVGYIKFETEVKTDVRRCVEDLKSLGIKEVVILSSQSESTISDIMSKSGIDKFYSVTDQESFLEIIKKYKKSSLLYRFGMDKFSTEGIINEVKYDGYNNYKDGDCITLAEDLSTPVNHLLLISNLKNLLLQNISIFILLEIFVAAATIGHYTQIWQVVVLTGIAKFLMKFYSVKNIDKV